MELAQALASAPVKVAKVVKVVKVVTVARHDRSWKQGGTL